MHLVIDQKKPLSQKCLSRKRCILNHQICQACIQAKVRWVCLKSRSKRSTQARVKWECPVVKAREVRAKWECLKCHFMARARKKWNHHRALPDTRTIKKESCLF